MNSNKAVLGKGAFGFKIVISEKEKNKILKKMERSLEKKSKKKFKGKPDSVRINDSHCECKTDNEIHNLHRD